MDITLPSPQKSPLVITTLAVVLLSLGLSLLTWQNLRQHKSAIQDHILLAARAISRGVENSLTNGLDNMGLPTGELRALFRPLAGKLLQELIRDGDVRFIEIYSSRGTTLISTRGEGAGSRYRLPKHAFSALGSKGEWYEQTTLGGRPTFVFGRISTPSLNKFCPDDSCLSPMPPLLVIGLDMDNHIAFFNKFKKTAILQTAYALLVILVVWGLAAALLRRKDQSGKLLQLESFQSSLLDHMPDGLLTIDAEGSIRSANPAAGSLLAPNGSGLLDCALRDVLPEADRSRRQQGRATMEWAQIDRPRQSLEVLFLPLGDDSSQTLVLLRDRTEIRGLESELNRAEKLAAVGRLAAGMAHEIRNPLSALRGFAQYFTTKLAGQDPAETYARTMVQEADRLNKVITDLLFLAKPKKIAPETFPLNEITKELHSLLSMDICAHQAQWQEAGTQLLIRADRDSLKQALLNLLVNGLAALPEQGGRLSITARSSAEAVEITVADNGSGMSEKAIEHALEPFFTTRAKGTGLGLAIVHTIIQEHGGTVSVNSREGHGTEVTLLFPAPEQPQPPEPTCPDQPPS
ncbi:MAG TPA: ATP-binding protein [Desulfomicrobiaceae bacterium]|nr:ATP-binding protein [Desulfomicrobiaceae bacterium]